MANEVDRLMAMLPEPWRVVVQPEAAMGSSWGAAFAWPRKEIWVCARDPEQMVKTLCHEIAHALTWGHGHDEAWHRVCGALWDEVFPDRRGFAEHIDCHLERS
jgi:hypothetical protein